MIGMPKQVAVSALSAGTQVFARESEPILQRGDLPAAVKHFSVDRVRRAATR